MSKATPTPWGVSILDRTLGSDEPREDGAMILSPPPEERKRKREAGEYPITTVRVAMLEATHYTPHAVAIANAEFIVRAVNAHAALAAALEQSADSWSRFAKLFRDGSPSHAAAIENEQAARAALAAAAPDGTTR